MSGEYEKALASGYSQHLRRMGWGETELIAQTRRFIRAVKAEAWDEGREAERDYTSAFNNWREHITDHMPETPTNPYQADT